MVDFCYSIIRKHWNGKSRLLAYRCIKVFLYLVYPLYIKVAARTGVNTESSVIVSLTSFPPRMDKIHLVIESILRQTTPPQKVILWLAKEQFDGISLPDSLLKLQKYGLEISYCEDLRSHKKYYPAMKAYPDATIITADDDMIYPERWIERLTETANKYPNTVICMQMRRILLSEEGQLLPYEQWPSHVTGIDAPRFDLMPVGCLGVLYPPGVMHEDIFDKDFFMSACRNADDLWLKAMSLMNRTKVMTADPNPISYVDLPSAKVEALNAVNVGMCENDIQFRQILARYPQILDIIKKNGT